MVSKTLLVACVALLCAQAFAYPRKEKNSLGSNPIGCEIDIVKSLPLIPELGLLVGHFHTIIENANAAKYDCSMDQDATADTIAACEKAATYKEVGQIVALVAEIGSITAGALPTLKDLLDDCW